MRVSSEKDHPWDNMILEKMLVRNAPFYKPYAMLLDEASHQVMKVGDLLIWSGERMIDHEMDFRWVPDLRDAHLAKDFDGERPSAVLSHGEVSRKNGNISGVMDILSTIGSDANYVLPKGQRIITLDVFKRRRSGVSAKS